MARPVLTAHLTPGHTKGCTTWTMKVSEGGKSYDAVIVGSPNVNAGFRLVNNAKYPRIAGDYSRTFEVLKSLHCDIFLGAHGDYYGLEASSPLRGGGAGRLCRPRWISRLCSGTREGLPQGIGIPASRRSALTGAALLRGRVQGLRAAGLYSPPCTRMSRISFVRAGQAVPFSGVRLSCSDSIIGSGSFGDGI